MIKRFVHYTIAALITSLSLGFTANAADFNAGRIIDDGVFTNRSSMTVSDIQGFLNTKVPVCDTNGTKPSEYGGGTRAQWASARYGQSTFTCLKSYTENGKSAAQIIYDVAQQYTINPQVLIVLLQKEQGLVTDEWPLNTQYRTATGYGCPDTAPCDSQYYGLTNQLSWAGKMFRAIMNNSPTWYTPYVLGNNYIRYSPDSSCGGSTVNIQNRATQALYNYTPYQPNQAALNAGWGTATCGAYGNRNFFLYFTNWFGSTEISYQNVKDSVNFERLVGTDPAVRPDTNSLGTSSATITADSILHTFYYDDTSGVLKHAWSDNSGWHTETLDGDAARQNGSIKANVGAYVTGFYDGESIIRIYYYDATSQSLRQGIYDISQATWNFNTLDGTGGQSGYTGNVGEGIAAVKYGNYTQLMYYDQSNGNLRHAWTGSQGWRFENLDGDRGSIGKRDVDLGITPTVTVFRNHLQLFYHDATSGNLRHAWTDDIRGWNFENFDGDNSGLFNYTSNLGVRPVAKVYGSDLFVFYFDQSKNLWRMAYADNDGWHAADYDGSSRGLSRSAYPTRGRISVDVYGTSLQTFYQDSTGGLKHAWINR